MSGSASTLLPTPPNTQKTSNPIKISRSEQLIRLTDNFRTILEKTNVANDLLILAPGTHTLSNPSSGLEISNSTKITGLIGSTLEFEGDLVINDVDVTFSNVIILLAAGKRIRPNGHNSILTFNNCTIYITKDTPNYYPIEWTAGAFNINNTNIINQPAFNNAARSRVALFKNLEVEGEVLPPIVKFNTKGSCYISGMNVADVGTDNKHTIVIEGRTEVSVVGTLTVDGPILLDNVSFTSNTKHSLNIENIIINIYNRVTPAIRIVTGDVPGNTTFKNVDITIGMLKVLINQAINVANLFPIHASTTYIGADNEVTNPVTNISPNGSLNTSSIKYNSVYIIGGIYKASGIIDTPATNIVTGKVATKRYPDTDTRPAFNP